MLQAIIVAAIAATPPTIVALLAILRIKEVHVLMNSRLTELLIATAAASRAEGRESMSPIPDPVPKLDVKE